MRGAEAVVHRTSVLRPMRSRTGSRSRQAEAEWGEGRPTPPAELAVVHLAWPGPARSAKVEPEAPSSAEELVGPVGMHRPPPAHLAYPGMAEMEPQTHATL